VKPTCDEEVGLTAEHRRAVLAAIPAAVTAKPGWTRLEPRVWADLARVIRDYRSLHSLRQHYSPVKAERARLQRILTQARKLEKELRVLQERPSIIDLCGPRQRHLYWIDALLTALRQAPRGVKTHAAYLDTWAAFSGKKNPHRELLYFGVLRVWTRQLRCPLTYWWTAERKLAGPVVAFFTACLRPVLGDETPAAGIADIIDGERRRVRELKAIRQLITQGMDPREALREVEKSRLHKKVGK
jgi:hypothetical protein